MCELKHFIERIMKSSVSRTFDLEFNFLLCIALLHWNSGQGWLLPDALTFVSLLQ